MSLLSRLMGNKSTISHAEAKSIIEQNPDAIILDVRTKDEYNTVRIKNAVLIPVSDLYKRAEKKLPDKDAKILVYCHSGARAGQAVQLLSNMGYTDVVSFGGIQNWPYEVENG